MPDDSFELIPHREFIAMRKDVAMLKQNPFGPRTDEILSKINELSKSLNLMVDAFKEASSATASQEVTDFSKIMSPSIAKMDAVIEQNKKIAQGILAVADIAKEALSKVNELEMKLSSPKKQEEQSMYRPVMQEYPDIRPLNVPVPPPSASSFVPHENLSQPQFSPPPLPNQMQQGNPRPMQSGFPTKGPVRAEKKLFSF